MNKSTELDIIRDTVARLGTDSYCGPWLNSQIDAIAAAMASDECPSLRALSLTEARQQAEQTVAVARVEANRLLAKARSDAEQIVAEAHRRANYAIDNAQSALRAALSRL